MEPDCEVHAFKPPKKVRHVSKAKAAAMKSAPNLSSWAMVAALALAVKMSTTMLAFVNWQSGMNKAMAAPVATPVNSKSPTMV